MNIWLKELVERGKPGYEDDVKFTKDTRNKHSKYFLDSSLVGIDDHMNWYLTAIIRANTQPFYIIMEGTSRIGTISINYETETIGNVVLIPKRQGLGHTAMRIAEAKLKIAGCKVAKVIVKDDNPDAINFYHSLDYRGTYVCMERSLDDD